MALHDDEVTVTLQDTAALIRRQVPKWASLPLTPAGEGTDNIMMRLGDDLVVRLPRTPGTSEQLLKEQQWIPHLAPHLPLPIPTIEFVGHPDEYYPFHWAVYQWIHGEPLGDSAVDDWATVGSQLAEFVAALHSAPLADAVKTEGLTWYRGDPLATLADSGFSAIESIRTISLTEPVDLDLDTVEAMWRKTIEVPQTIVDDVWLHGDLRSANLIACNGKLAGVIDFGCLSLGQPAAEHSAGVRLPSAGAKAFRESLGLSDDEWALATGWVLLPQLTSMPYYWNTWREFGEGCRDEIQRLLRHSGHD